MILLILAFAKVPTYLHTLCRRISFLQALADMLDSTSLSLMYICIRKTTASSPKNKLALLSHISNHADFCDCKNSVTTQISSRLLSFHHTLALHLYSFFDKSRLTLCTSQHYRKLSCTRACTLKCKNAQVSIFALFCLFFVSYNSREYFLMIKYLDNFTIVDEQ